MKRRMTARCAAANDDDLAGDSNSDTEAAERAAQRKARKSSEGPSPEAAASGQAVAERGADGRPPRRRKKQKAFAWMDSGEEDGDEEEDEQEEKAAEVESKHGSDDENEDATADKLDTVQSFGRMMLLAPGLRRLLRSDRVTPADVAAAYRVLGRTKFFDSDILQELNTALLMMLEQDKLSVAQANDAVLSLAALNAYNAKVFSTIANTFRSKTAAVDPAIRTAWVEVFRSFNHDQQKDFLQLLEVPPLLQINPAFQRIRCRHHSAGGCALGDQCSYSHDPRAPLSLDVTVRHVSPVVMTQNQYTMGRTIYGGARNGQFA